ncbi:NmrA family transcriptional regulator [Luteitalea sp. TBR-22]|uniref:NAD(P)-dependent oxidoreductase n=1 Tax=Luteitalea sp. TBR-22 TaxID=2802971 RepID=UPI001AF5E14E|nr:NAD(P)H-binding protein [Luteitalea sp. TBR-22]BCS34772.1 NmrA family transcriptional regulator [Luteitalea sp. TBR-22]
MNVLVVGATGGSGRAVIAALLNRGHNVTAMVRRPASSPPFPEGVRVVQGDAMRATDVEQCVRGQDAVVVTLGIREPALRVRLRGSADTPLHVRSQGTRHVIAMMRRHGVQKLVVLTSFGVGPTRAHLPLKWRLIFALLLRPQIADTEIQQAETVSSGLRWVVAQPVALTDVQPAPEPFASVDGEVRGMAISRHSVAKFLADAVEGDAFDHRIVALS